MSSKYRIQFLTTFSIAAIACYFLVSYAQKEIEKQDAIKRAWEEQTSEDVAKMHKRLVEEAEIQACKEKGGVPSKTLILGRLKRCDFPTK